MRFEAKIASRFPHTIMENQSYGHEEDKDANLCCKASNHKVVRKVQLCFRLCLAHDSRADQLQEETDDISSNKHDSKQLWSDDRVVLVATEADDALQEGIDWCCKEDWRDENEDCLEEVGHFSLGRHSTFSPRKVAKDLDC